MPPPRRSLTWTFPSRALAAEVAPILDDMGVDLAYAVRCPLREFIRDPRLPRQPNQETVDAMEAGLRGETRKFGSVAALMADSESGDEDG